MSSFLSKSKILDGLQCTKRLYFSVHSPEVEPKVSENQKPLGMTSKIHRFNEGIAVGREAQKHFPGGVLIKAPNYDRPAALKETETVISTGANTLFEAAFVFDEVFVRVDILHRDSRNEPWEVIEVKSSTSVKDEHLTDVAIQKFVLESNGLRIKSYQVMFVNNQCVYPNLEDLFSKQDVTENLNELVLSIAGKISEFKKVLAEGTPPKTDIGPHCDEPYECPFKNHCWKAKNLPEISIFDIPGLKANRKWELYRDGIINLTQLKGEKLNPTQKRMVDVSLSGRRFIDTKSIEMELSQWQYPLHYLDFETLGPAIPRFNGTRPYQGIPFQFSCHVQLEPGTSPIPFGYLHDGPSDPREPLLEKILKSIGEAGSIVAYNKSVESRCLKVLAEHSPHHATQIDQMIERLVDPWPLVKGAVYDKNFRGGFSIKDVAPALLKLEYEGLEISEGTQASVAFDEMVSPETNPERREHIRAALLKYCGQDTIAIWKLVEWLRQQVPKSQSA